MGHSDSETPETAAGPPVEPGHDVPDTWLAEFDGDPAARNLERLASDNELYFRLAYANFAGQEWDRFADLLARYGFQVLGAWLSTGMVYRKCRDMRIVGVVPPTRPLNAEECRELAVVTVGVAIAAFRDRVLARGLWDASRGASLKTYFIGQVLFRFRDELRRFVSERGGQPTRDPFQDDRAHPADSRSLARTEDLVMTTLELKSMQSKLPQRTVAVLALDAGGWAQSEIAELLGISVGAVESLLYRHRKAVRRNGRRTGE